MIKEYKVMSFRDFQGNIIRIIEFESRHSIGAQLYTSKTYKARIDFENTTNSTKKMYQIDTRAQSYAISNFLIK